MLYGLLFASVVVFLLLLAYWATSIRIVSLGASVETKLVNEPERTLSARTDPSHEAERSTRLPAAAFETSPVMYIEKTPAPHLPHALDPLYEHAREFVFDGNWSRVLSAADVYKNGIYPEYIPDEDMALRLYHICASCPDGDVSGMGQARYVELRLDPVAVEDRGGRPLPRDPGTMISSEAHERIARTPYDQFQTPMSRSIGALKRRQAWERRPSPNMTTALWRTDRELDQVQQLMQGIDEVAAALDAQVPSSTQHHRSDAQNVHDHAVSSGVRSTVKGLITEFGIPDPRRRVRAIETVRDAILTSDETNTSKTDALEVLENLTESMHSGFGVSEQEVLALVAQKINSIPDSKLHANVLETLVKQLASAKERGLVVCSSGKITRMIGAFDGTGLLETEARPLWAVREEMGTLAAKVRDRHGDNDAAARAVFERLAYDEYVGRVGMSKTIIAPIIEEYADAF